MSPDARLQAQLDFLLEADRLKSVTRATPLADNSRAENSAEHSWHLALFALTLAEQAPAGVDPFRVIQMLILHDIVEIDAGDTPIHGVVDHAAVARAEAAAADRLFGLLPPDQAGAFRAIWDEFEAAETPDAIFAKALDRAQPLMLNHASGGGSWLEFDVTLDQIDTRVGTKVRAGAPRLWAALRSRITPWFTKRGR